MRDQTGISPLVTKAAQKVDHRKHPTAQVVLDRRAFLPVRLIAETLGLGLDRVERFGMGQGLTDQKVTLGIAQMARLR